MRRVVAMVACALAVSTGLAVVSASPSQATSRVHLRLRAAIKHLSVASETPRGYDRDKFRLWIDANGDCQDTRAEVLVQESLAPVSGGCTITRGRWFSYYDHVTTHDPSSFDIDHLVPLAEAWASGAKRWNGDTRRRYANDLRDKRTLVAVTAHSNRSKGDRDPAEWMPEYGQCKYVKQWTAVKIRWHLKVNRAEKHSLASRASHCKDVYINVRKARVVTGTSGGGGGTSGGCEPGYSPCLPIVSDLDCNQIPDWKKPIKVTGSDPYGLDADGDGWGCDG